MSAEEMISQLAKGNRRILARSLTHIENNTALGQQLINHLYLQTGKAQIIGITGPPGAGKSTLVNALIGKYRQQNLSVAILAIDPTSPYSGGALLGDRIRMLEYTSDPGVYIRSMASRGKLGGLSLATFDATVLFDFFGFDRIIIETVGAGQSEVDIAKNCDTTVVLMVPGLGDDIQIIKAGIMEIANIFVVNKADRPGSKELAQQIKNMLHSADSKEQWQIPVELVSAIEMQGIDELIQSIDKHGQHINHGSKRLEHRKDRIREELVQRFLNSEQLRLAQMDLDAIVDMMVTGKLDLAQALDKLEKH